MRKGLKKAEPALTLGRLTLFNANNSIFSRQKISTTEKTKEFQKNRF